VAQYQLLVRTVSKNVTQEVQQMISL